MTVAQPTVGQSLRTILLVLSICLVSWDLKAQNAPVAQDRIVVKLTTGSTLQGREAAIFPGAKLSPIFHPKVTAAQAKGNLPRHEIERWHYLYLPQGMSIDKALEAARQLENISVAEPYPLPHLMVVPNDPQAQIAGGAQDYLELISAYEGWDITTGDPATVVAILDSGSDLDHSDIQGQLAYNYADPVDGVDNDGNGYTDDFAGYDLADNDPDVSVLNDPHGFRVAGLSSAATNNGLGIAGIGYQCKYLPIKTFRDSDDEFQNGYEAIVYAAEQGAQVINLSWGSTTSSTQYVRDIIDYVVDEHDVVLVAAAGNTPSELDFYPASLPKVLSVGASNLNDLKASFATWSPLIDLMAPGEAIYTLDSGNTYRSVQGSSFAAPMVSGTAALIRSYRPHLTAAQVREQIRVSADDIYAFGTNVNYPYSLGRGRLNVARALSDTTKAAVRLENWAYQGTVGPYVNYDDTLYITGEFASYLAPWIAGKATLQSSSPYITLIDSVWETDNLGTLERSPNDTLFVLYLEPDLPANTNLLLRVDFTGESYVDWQNLRLKSEPSYLTLDNGTQQFTLSSDGELGYQRTSGLVGIGWNWNGDFMLDHIGLLIGTDTSHVADNAVENTLTRVHSADFTALSPIKRFGNSQADIDVRSWFAEGSDTPLFGIRMYQRWLASQQTGEGNWILAEYRLVNHSNADIDSLSIGWIGDWGLDRDGENIAAYDSTGRLAYVADTAQGLFAGVAWISLDSALYQAIDWDTLHGNLSDVDTVLSKADKYRLLASPSPDLTAGSQGIGNDVGLATGFWIPRLESGANHPVVLSLITGFSIDELRAAANQARAYYQDYRATPPLLEVIEVCSETPIQLNPTQGNDFIFYADAFGLQPLDTSHILSLSAITADTTVYVVNLDSGYQTEVYRVEVVIREPSAQFTIAQDTLVMIPNGFARTSLTQSSVDAAQYAWDFGNGIQSSLQTPAATYFGPGNYAITLGVTNDLGCQDTLTQYVRVFQRANEPLVSDLAICAGDSPSLSATNASTIGIYADDTLGQLLYTGPSFTPGQLFADSTVWVTNQDSLFESLPVAVTFRVTSVQAALRHAPDTTQLDQLGAIMQYTGTGANQYQWYLDGTSVGAGTSQYVPLNGESALAIGLVVSDSVLGCTDSIGVTLTPKAGPSVIKQTLHMCAGQDVLWQPTQGALFAFASNADGTNIVHKGTQYTTRVTHTDTIWVANLDSLLPGSFSPLVARTISADYSISPDQDTLQVLDTTYFTAADPLITTHLWQIENGSFRTGNPLKQVWLATGTYQVRLLALDSLGCRDTADRNWVVIPRQVPGDTVTAIPEDVTQFVTVYPNPTQHTATIYWQKETSKPQALRITNMQGQTVLEEPWRDLGDTMQVSLADLPPGLYTLYLLVENHLLAMPIWKQ